MRLLTLCLCLLLMPKFVEAEEKEVIINSLSLLKMCEELGENPRLQQKLQLTSTQVKKVGELVRDKKFQKTLLEQARAAEGTGGNHDIPWSIDAENLTAEIRNLLGEKQILDLRRFLLAMRCPMGISPFADFEILDACGIDKEDAHKALVEKGEQYSKKRRLLKIQAFTSFLGQLSESDKVLIAQFLGNRYMPGILVSAKPAAEIGEVPFLDPAWAIQSYTLRDLLDLQSPLASQIGISSQQKLQLTELEQSTPRGLSKQLLRTYFGRLRNIITDEQIISLARIRNEAWILNDCSWPFRQPQIKDYLGLNEREAKALLTLAESEHQKLSEQIATLDRQTFQEVCEKIPAPGRLKIQRLFADVW